MATVAANQKTVGSTLKSIQDIQKWLNGFMENVVKIICVNFGANLMFHYQSGQIAESGSQISEFASCHVARHRQREFHSKSLYCD